MDYAKQYQEYLARANQALEKACETFLPEESEVCRAARYSLLGGGKRIRAVLVLAVCDMLNGSAEAAEQFAAAVEMLHCYSLIHDDLPCMDNDDLRRGKPSCHKAFGESTAMLAGDVLLTEAFNVVANAPASPIVSVRAARALGAGAGSHGMVYGQELDLKYEALAATERVCASVNVGSTKAGINMDAVAEMGRIIKKTAALTEDNGCMGCAKLVVFANAVEDNPFMAGAFHGVGEPECVINVGVSGPGVVYHALQKVKGQPFDVVAETIKKTAFQVTRMGQLVGVEASRRLGVPFGIVDLSLAPTPAVGDSVARILEEMGLEVCGTHGTTAALALLNDAVKKGGVMASNHVGGLSGAFIPVSEDEGMIAAAQRGTLVLDKLEAMTCVCSVGLDMIAVPGDTSAATISAIIADEAAIGMVNTKTTAVRIIPALGKQVGDMIELGGLLGSAPVMPLHSEGSEAFVARGGRIPAPLQSLKN